MNQPHLIDLLALIALTSVVLILVYFFLRVIYDIFVDLIIPVCRYMLFDLPTMLVGLSQLIRYASCVLCLKFKLLFNRTEH